GPWSRRQVPVRQRRHVCVGPRDLSRAWLRHAWRSSGLVGSLVAVWWPSRKRRPRRRSSAIRPEQRWDQGRRWLPLAKGKAGGVTDERCRAERAMRDEWPVNGADGWL